MADLNKFVEEIEKMTVVEVNDLVKMLEEKFGVSAAALLIFETVKHIKLRTLFWLLMLGLCICVDAVMPFVITFLACSATDEFIVEPINRFYRKKFQAIDTARETAEYIQETN